MNMAEDIDKVIASICTIVNHPEMVAAYKTAIEAQAKASAGKYTPLAIAQATLADVQSKIVDEAPPAPVALPAPAPAPAHAAPAAAALPPAPAVPDDQEIPGDDDELTQQSFADWMSGVQSKIIAPRKVFEGNLVLKLTGEAPQTVRTNFNENVRSPGADGKMTDVFEKNPDKTLKLDGAGQPIHVVRKKIQVLVSCLGKDGIRYRVAQNMGFKKAIGDYLRKFGADGVQSYWKIATLASKAGEADVMVIEKVP